MAKINRLSTHLVNKIAAGEVIERPASVVKELVENSIDAGATRIEVVIEDGGKKLIQISDNGCGMGREDIALAFAPHATSKLANEDGLFNILTMGFRGEALASIASISHAHIRTRQHDDANGWEVTASGENIAAPSPCPSAAGTTISIRDLFFNTPARRKFMRTTNTEFGHISEQLTRLALPHPEIAFTLRHNNREIFNLPACQSTMQRVADLFTPDLAESLMPLVPRNSITSINGVVAPPSAARSSAKWQYVFLNGRYIRDRMISHALRESYRGRIMPTKFPVVFIFIEIDPAEVDINVHPTKIEVRFRNSNGVYGDVLAALKETLNKADLGADMPAESLTDAADAFGDPSPKQAQTQESLKEALADFFKKAPAPQPRLSFPKGQNAGPQSSAPAYQPERNNAPHVMPENFPQPASLPDAPTESAYELSQAPKVPAIPVMQIHNSYIVAQIDGGMMIVDQHALHERINYNEFKRRLIDGDVTCQKMLIPQTISVTQSEASIIEASKPLLTRLGFEIEQFGPTTYAIQQYPTLLAERGVEMEGFLRELIDAMSEDETTDEERLLESVLAMMACKASVKAGTPLGEEEMRQLIAAMDGLDKSNACPHGRPTTLNISLKELEKSFKRI